MYTAKGLLATSILLATLSAACEPARLSVSNQAPPQLGQPLAPQQTGSITVWPNGKGLPAGSGNALIGQKIYTQKCQACHGAAGAGGINDALVGGQVTLTELPKSKTLGSYWPYATSLFDYVRRSMPYREPGSLSHDEVYAVVAYLLFLNGVIEEHKTLDAARLSEVKLPNRQRFYSEYELPQ